MAFRAKKITDAQLNGRFSRNLIKTQLERLSMVADEAETVKMREEILNGFTESIWNKWLSYDNDVEMRPRYILGTGLRWPYTPMHILLSEYSSNLVNGTPHEVIKIAHRHFTHGFVNLPVAVIIALGGEARVCRLLAVGGLRLVIDELRKTQSYLTGMIGQGIINEMERFLEIERKGLGL